MHTVYRLALIITILLVSVFGCKTAPRYQKGGNTSQTFPSAPALAPVTEPAPAGSGVSQTLTQPENAQGQSKQDMVEEKTVVRPDGTVERTRRSAGTVIGGSQSLTDILKTYYDDEYSKRMILALLLGVAAWYLRTEWPVKAGVCAVGAVLTAFFGPIAAACTALFCGGIFVAYHVLKSRIPVPLP